MENQLVIQVASTIEDYKQQKNLFYFSRQCSFAGRID